VTSIHLNEYVHSEALEDVPNIDSDDESDDEEIPPDFDKIPLYESDELLDDETDKILDLISYKRLSCIDHSLQRVLVNAVNPAKIRSLAAVLSLVGRFKKSVKATKELVDKAKKGMLLPASTRWASVQIVLERFLEVKDVAIEVCAF
jgi:hypothetical protein